MSPLAAARRVKPTPPARLVARALVREEGFLVELLAQLERARVIALLARVLLLLEPLALRGGVERVVERGADL